MRDNAEVRVTATASLNPVDTAAKTTVLHWLLSAVLLRLLHKANMVSAYTNIEVRRADAAADDRSGLSL